MNNIKTRRTALGLSREDLASRAKCSYQFIRLLESADPPDPQLEKCRDIADALETSVDKLFPRTIAEPVRAMR